MRVLLFCGLAFKLADERLDDGDFGRAEDARGRQRRTGLAALLDERGRRQAFERIAVADEAVFEVQALRFQRAEEPFDDQRQRWRSMIRVASASEVAACVVNRRPDDRTFARRRIDLVRLDEIERQLRRIAYPSAPAPIVAETEPPRNARRDNPYPLFSPSRLSHSCPHDADRTFHATIIHYVSKPARGQVDKVKAPRPLARC